MNIINLLIIVILSNDGTLVRQVQKVESCPDKEVVVTMLERARQRGELRDWEAFCLPVVKQTEASQ